MSLRRNVLANFIGQGWSTLMGFAFIPVYIRLIGLEAYGLIGIFALLQTWLGLLDFGMTPAIGREMARYMGGGHDPQSIRDLLRSVELAAAAIGTATALGVWISSGWLSSEWLHFQSLRAPEVAFALGIMGIVVGSRFAEGVYRSSAVGLQRQVSLNVVVTVLATVRAFGAIVALTVGPATITTFFIWQAFVSAITVATLAVLVHSALPPAPRPSRLALTPLRQVWRFAVGTLAITVLGFLLSQFDKLILSALLTLSAFAVYSISYSVASFVRVLAQPIDQAVYPRMTQLYEEKNESDLAVLYHKAAQYNSVAMGGVGVFVTVFGDRLLRLWTGDAELASAAYAVLWILAIGMVLNGLMNTPYYLQLAAGWTSLLVRINSILVVVFVPATFLLTQRFQMTGAASAWVGLNIAYLLIVARLVHRRLLKGQLGDWFINDLVAPLLTSSLVAISLKLLLPSDLEGIQQAIALGLSLAAVVLAGGLAAKHVRSAMSTHLRQLIGTAA